MQFYCALLILVLTSSVQSADEIEDAYLTAPQLLEKYGYPTETHYVTTEDGYILTIHHVLHGKDSSAPTKKPVIVQHGLLGSSDDFLLLGPEKALVYALADEGYDVWLPNSRGNKYSRNHTTLNPNNPAGKFWDFSWHEMGIYDNPAVIDFILEQTGEEKLFHIAQAQGVTAFYVLTSEKPEYNDKVIAHFSYSPLAFAGHNHNPALKLGSLLTPFIQPVIETTGLKEAIFGDKLVRYLAPKVCSADMINDLVCKNVYFLIFGFNKKELNESLVPIIFGHFPAGASIDQLIHYEQLIKSKKFRQFDHGLIKNLAIYGSPSPPDYDLSKITAPIYIYYSLGDTFVDYRDAELVRDNINSVVEFNQMDDPDWSNTDFLNAISAKEKLYEPTITTMNSL